MVHMCLFFFIAVITGSTNLFCCTELGLGCHQAERGAATWTGGEIDGQHHRVGSECVKEAIEFMGQPTSCCTHINYMLNRCSD